MHSSMQEWKIFLEVLSFRLGERLRTEACSCGDIRLRFRPFRNLLGPFDENYKGLTVPGLLRDFGASVSSKSYYRFAFWMLNR